MAAANKPSKAREDRAREAEMIRRQLDDLGFPEESLKGIMATLEAFVEEGVSATQTFKFRDLGASVLLQLSMQPHVISFARVRRLS